MKAGALLKMSVVFCLMDGRAVAYISVAVEEDARDDVSG